MGLYTIIGILPLIGLPGNTFYASNYRFQEIFNIKININHCHIIMLSVSNNLLTVMIQRL